MSAAERPIFPLFFLPAKHIGQRKGAVPPVSEKMGIFQPISSETNNPYNLNPQTAK